MRLRFSDFRMDRRVWNRKNLIVVAAECAVAFNIDLYTSSVPFWMEIHHRPDLPGTANAIAMASQFFGICLSLYIVDRYGSKPVQWISFLVIFVAAAITSLASSPGLVMLAQGIRYAACHCALVSIGVVLQEWLTEQFSSAQEVQRARGKLFTLGFFVAATGAGVGPWLLTEHIAVWRWIAPIITVIGFVATLLSPGVPPVKNATENQTEEQIEREKLSLWPHPQVLKIVLPTFGTAICTGAISTYLVLDVGTEIGSPARSSFYLVQAFSGAMIVTFLTKFLDEKGIICLSVVLMMGAMALIYQSTLVGVIGASIVIAACGQARDFILRNQTFYMKPQGRRTATFGLVACLGAILGNLGFGWLRHHIHMDAWLLLIPMLGLTLLGFIWSFRFWREKESRA